MKRLIILPFLALIALLSQSCQTVVDVDLPEPENRLVVNCLFAQDSSFYFQISHTATILDPDSIQLLKGASIKLTASTGEEETITETANYFLQFEEKEYYKSNMKAVSGASYTIEVSHPEYATVTSQATVPSGVVLNSIDTSTVIESGYKVFRMSINFSDPIGKNFYDVRLYYSTIQPIYDDMGNVIGYVPYVTQLFYYPINEGILSENSGTSFNDELFDGQDFQLNLNVDNYYFEGPYWGDSVTQNFPGVLVTELRNISEDYFEYEQSLNKYYMAEGDPFAQPVQVTTNIDGGLGIFAGYGLASDTFIIQ